MNQSIKTSFVDALKSKGKYRYGRYQNLPIRYAGGKSLAVGFVVEQIPTSIQQLVSPFIGGGSVEIACANTLNMKVQGYDLFDILCNYWKIQLRMPITLADRISKWNPTQENYNQVKSRLKEHWINNVLIENNLELAAHDWFNHNLSYGPGFLGWISKIYKDDRRFKRLVEKVRRF